MTSELKQRLENETTKIIEESSERVKSILSSKTKELNLIKDALKFKETLTFNQVQDEKALMDIVDEAKKEKEKTICEKQGETSTQESSKTYGSVYKGMVINPM